ncbi:MAG: hypothetical protein HDT32_06540 [Clostridiales bacterium]|nr:hypothetical protein [Clostridiales bacterium]
MNSLTKRKLTAVVVSIMLIAAVVTTGILCAPNLHKSNPDAGIISALDLNDFANYRYNAYDGEYAVGRVSYTNQNTAMINITETVYNEGVDIWYPTEIYLDSTETLQSAGYYYHLFYTFSQKGIDNDEFTIWNNVFGLYSSGHNVNTGALSSEALTFNTVFGATYEMNTKYYNDGCSNLTMYANRGARFNESGGAGINTSRATNSAIGSRYNGSKSDPRLTLAMQGTPGRTGDFTYIAAQYTGDDPNSNSPVALLERRYKTRSWALDSGTWYHKTITQFSESSRTSVDWVRAPQDENSTQNDNVLVECSGIPNSGTEMKIQIHVYNKTELYKAMAKLTLSYNDLKDFATNAADAKDLIDEAAEMLKTRAVTAEDVDKLTKNMNDFVFTVGRPVETFPTWTYGDKNGNETKLETLWVDGYNATTAKYFDAHIHNDVYGQFDTAKTDPEKTEDRWVSDKASYENRTDSDKGGYVKNAGEYTITFTTRGKSDADGRYHPVKWTDNPDTTTSTMKLTILRGNMDVDTSGFNIERRYTGEALAFTMSTGSGVVTLKGNMALSSANLVVKLSNYDLGSDNAREWNDCTNTVSFTEVGIHRVYYRLQADNHVAYRGSYTLRITPAQLDVTFKTGANRVSTIYGEEVLSSSDILTNGVASVKLNGQDTSISLTDVIEVGVFTGTQDSATQITNRYTNAKEDGYPVKIIGYGALSNADLQVDSYEKSQYLIENQDEPINSWSQRVTVTLHEDNSAYVINRKEVTINWNMANQDEQVFDGLSGRHRPDESKMTVEGKIDADGKDFVFHVRMLGDGSITIDGNTYIAPLVDRVEENGVLVDGTAVWAGTYTATAVLSIDGDTSVNYRIAEGRTQTFEIKQRDLVVDMKEMEFDYAQTINTRARSTSASEFLAYYTGMLFKGNDTADSEDAKIYNYGNGTSLAITGLASMIFEVDIVGATTTVADPDKFGESDNFYTAGRHEGALVARLRTVAPGEFDEENNPILQERVNSYNFTCNPADLVINEATIVSDRQDMHKTFRTTPQEFALNANLLRDKGLSGYELMHVNEEGVVRFEYSLDQNGEYSTDPIKLYGYRGGQATVIYYKIIVANHKEVSGNFEAYIDRLPIDINIGNQTVVYYYGDEIPGNDELIAALGLTSTAHTNDDGQRVDYPFAIGTSLEFYLTDNGQAFTNRDHGAGNYSLALRAKGDGELLENYIINWTGRLAAGAFTISQRPLIIDWRQNGDEWKDGMSYIYDTTIPTIQPVVRQYRHVDADLADANQIGDVTADDNDGDYTENYLTTATSAITLRSQRLGGATVGSYATAKASLQNANDQRNYYLVNDTTTFYIVQRVIEIDVFDRSAPYGSARSIPMGQLTNPTVAGANWGYHNADGLKFIVDHYMNWELSTIAQLKDENQYRGVGTYPIVLSVRDGGNISDNYTIVVYRKEEGKEASSTPQESFDDVATFEITKANLSITSREFNFDASPKSENSSLPVEPCEVTIDDIRDIIRFVGATKKTDLTITMSDISVYGGEDLGNTIPEGTAMDASSVTRGMDELGRFYVWIKVTNVNYNDFVTSIYINNYSSWISIKFNSTTIGTNYGDDIMDSDALFNALRSGFSSTGNTENASIVGVMSNADNTGSQLTGRAAWDAIKTRGYFTLYVVDDVTTRLDVGLYTINMTVDPSKAVYTDSDGNQNQQLHIRFIGATPGKGKTSNVDKYEVKQRPVWLRFDPTINEVYGDHSDESPSHSGYELQNILPEDEAKGTVRPIVTYTNSDGSEVGLVGGHVHYVGDYIVRLTGVSHDNYRIATSEEYSDLGITGTNISKRFSITPRPITVTVKNQVLTYGSADARITGTNNNIDIYLNSDDIYTISGRGLYGGHKASDVFVLSSPEAIDATRDVSSNLNYLVVGTFNIEGDPAEGLISKQYDLRFETEFRDETYATLTINRATATIDTNTFRSVSFDGGQHCPLADVNDVLAFTFQGDADYIRGHRNTYFNANKDATASDDGWVQILRNGQYIEDNDFTFRDAATYTIAVMVRSDNHETVIRRDISYEILPVNVVINMTGTVEKTYGDVINGLSNRIKTDAKVSYAITTAGGTPWNSSMKTNIDDALEFYVVAGGEDGANGGAATANFTNDVGYYRVYHRFIDSNERANYVIDYATDSSGVRCNARAYHINTREAEVVWYTRKAGVTGSKTVYSEEEFLARADVWSSGKKFEYEYDEDGIGLRAAYKGIRYGESGSLETYYIPLNVTGQGTNARTAAYTANASFYLQTSYQTINKNYTLLPGTTTFEHIIVAREVIVYIANQGTVYGYTKAQIMDAFNNTDDSWDEENGETISQGIRIWLDLPTKYENGSYVDAGTYAIKAEYRGDNEGHFNFAVTFKNAKAKDDDSMGEGWGEYTVRKAAPITNMVDHMEGLIYNGAEQEVDVWSYINSLGDTDDLLEGAMLWTDVTITYSDTPGADGVYSAQKRTVKNATATGNPEKIYYKLSLNNYEDTYGVMNVSVARANVVYNANIVEIQYGENPLTSDELFKQMSIRVNEEESDPLAVQLKDLVYFEVVDNTHAVNTYKIVARFLNDEDARNITVTNQYDEIIEGVEESETAYPYHIVRRVLTVNWGETVFVYNARQQEFTADGFNNILAGEEISPATYSVVERDESGEVISQTNGNGIEVGKYEVKIVVNRETGTNANYVVDEACRYMIFEIVPKEVELTWNNLSFEYDREVHVPTPRIARGSILGTDSCNIAEENWYKLEKVEGNGTELGKDAGTYRISVVALSNKNYTVPDSQAATFVINPREVDINWNSESFTYDGQLHCITATVAEGGILGTDECEVIVNGEAKDAGWHNAVATGLTNPNYRLRRGNAGQSFSIAQGVISQVNWSNTSLTYQEVNGIGQAQLPTATAVMGAIPGETIEFEIIVSEGEAVNVGRYTATIVAIKGGNYSLDITNITTTFTINQADNAFVGEVKMPEPDGGLPVLADFASVTAKYGKATIKYYTDADCQNEYTGDISAAPKGTYYVAISVDGTENYKAVAPQVFSVEVEGKSNVGLIVGIVVPVAVVLIVGIVLAIVLSKKKKDKKDVA